MERYDMHMHLDFPLPSAPEGAAAAQLLAAMRGAGVAGGCLFSPSPKDRAMRFIPYEERMAALEAYTRGQEGCLFPVFWVHPDEQNAQEHVLDAAARGVLAFKFICDTYYVYEEKCLRLLRLIAGLGKPAIFHSGILWYGGETSKYNRPLNWEALIDIKGLRFSMGHCAWPWHDECIAMYGKFLHHLLETEAGAASEMFFDLTPGTPPIYRRDLLHKLFKVGYDVIDNLMFGTDSVAMAYNAEWVAGWIARDDALYRELDVPERALRKVYRDNLLRFLGLGGAPVAHVSPTQNAEGSIRLP